MTWTATVTMARLREKGRLATKVGERQIALFERNGVVHACNNRCPHEGYPLAEGTLDGGCVLTCNWHNWKFDLRSGENLLGGDRLRVYPTRIVDGVIWVDIVEPPAEERRARALANLREAADDHDYERIARELARFKRAGGDLLAALCAAIEASHDRLEYGATHAFAGSACWLALHDELGDDDARLATIVEAIGHIAWDVLREPSRPFAPQSHAYDESAFLAAVEAQDEPRAVALLRGALAAGARLADLERALTAAALRHYADFGHSLIYVMHASRLAARLGAFIEAPLLLALTRGLINASREDLLPEFRSYATALARWPKRECAAEDAPSPEDVLGASAKECIGLTADAASRADHVELHHALLGANALNQLRFDLAIQERLDAPIGENIGWLDFTHGLTFANAVRVQCTKFPELWPQGLLQLACFAGRNAGFTDRRSGIGAWRVGDRAGFFSACRAHLLDHGERDYIHSVHLLKTFCAVREEVATGLPGDLEELLLAALNRFFHSPLKRKHVLRTARQALAFVARE
jgi:nitrite reductase/ring-hydroxylating ferredoxin subunit